MARMACIVVKTTAGDVLPLAAAEAPGIDRLVNQYRDIIRDGGILRRGKTEIKLSEIRVLSNHTAGGELKSPKRFIHTPVV